MQAKKIIGLMKGEAACDEETLPELQHLVEEYPYFQAAHLLYTLNLQANKDSRFDAELKKTACYTGDRKKLLYHVESDFFTPEQIDKLEKREDAVPETSFDLIHFFLAEKEKNGTKPATKPVHPETVATDYVSYLLSDDQEEPAVLLQHQETIDKFLKKNEQAPVKIVLNKETETSVENPFPDLDTIEEGSFFSETLAKIYLKQKKYAQALEIIRKLNLIYPEKNRYFADQIRFLEKLIINTKK